MKRISCILAAVLMAAVLLTACGAQSAPPASSVPSASSEVQSAGASVPAQLPESEALPESFPPEADLSALPAALESCSAYGPGEAGCSLKEMIGACALLDCAQDTAAAPEQWGAAFDAWTEQAKPEQLELFWLNWPGLLARGDELCISVEELAPILDSAGNPNGHDAYDAEQWAPLKAAIASRAPAGSPVE